MLFVFFLFFFHYVSYISGTPIVGGVNASRKYKYQVSLQEIGRRNLHFCGGSIISDSWILTAAHCIDSERIEKDVKRIQIVAGITHLSEKGDKYFVKLCKIHENWDREKIANDIALLKTTKKIKFSSTVKPIALATHNPPDRTVTTLTGWGFTRVLEFCAKSILSGLLKRFFLFPLGHFGYFGYNADFKNTTSGILQNDKSAKLQETV